MMTKKDFELIAKVLFECTEGAGWVGHDAEVVRSTAHSMADALDRACPRFQIIPFLSASGAAG